MLDFGLLTSAITIVVVVAVATRWAPTPALGARSVGDRLHAPVIIGVLTGRVVAAALDDPTSLRSLRALLVIRGGVEFWPGVAAAIGVLVWGTRRRRDESAGLTLAELAPFLLWGYATWEATCLLRDGCYGPVSSIGLVPDGLTTRHFPVGLVVALGVTLLGVALHQLWGWLPWAKVAAAVAGVAAARSVASIWLPRLSDSLTRQHLQSLAVLGGCAVLAAGVTLRGWTRRDPREPWAAPSSSRRGWPSA
jgi:hypothetical protein